MTQRAAQRTKGRIPNKIQWALRDINNESFEARGYWEHAMKRAEKLLDPILVLNLGRLRDSLSKIERLAIDAESGEYRDSLLLHE